MPENIFKTTLLALLLAEAFHAIVLKVDVLQIAKKRN